MPGGLPPEGDRISDELTAYTENVVNTGVVGELPVVPESTTSRILVKNDLLQVTQFTFGAGQMLSEHAVPKGAVVQLLEGEMTFSLDGAPNPLRAGDSVYMAPGVLHSLRAETDCRMVLVLVDVSAMNL